MQQNPYDFITNAPTRSKKSFLPGGNSKTGRLILVGIGGLLLLLIVSVVFSLLNSGSSGLKTDYAQLVQQQTELVRISQIGATKAQNANAKNLAITTQLSIASQQNELLDSAKKSGARTDAKSLGLGKNPETDQEFSAAEQANNFDEVFTTKLIENLQSYQMLLRKIYDSTSSNNAKDSLSKAYNAVDDLLKNISAES